MIYYRGSMPINFLKSFPTQIGELNTKNLLGLDG